MYRSRKDLLRRLDWLFSSNGGAETTDIELVLDSTVSSTSSSYPGSGTTATEILGSQPVETNPATQIIIPTHKCILASGSEALRTLISLQTYENDNSLSSLSTNGGKKSNPNGTKPRVYLKGVSPLTAGALLQFLYTGSTRFDQHNTIDVLLASERLGLSVLSRLAERHLPTIINEDNVCNILIIGNTNRLTGLSAIATSYALRHFDGIMDTALATSASSSSNGFLQLPRAILASLLAHSDLCILSEEKLLHGILRWGIANLPTGIMKDIPVTASSSTASTKKSNPSASASYLSSSGNEIPSTPSYAKQNHSIASAAGYLNNNSTLPSQLSIINGTMTNSSTSGLVTISASSDIIDSAHTNLPAVPMTAIPGLKSLLLELFSALRWASMDIPILKSPIVSAIVAPELILQAMFEKMGGNTNPPNGYNPYGFGMNDNLLNNGNTSFDSFGTSGLLTNRSHPYSSTLIHNPSNSTTNNGILLNRSSLLPSLDQSPYPSLYSTNHASTVSTFDNHHSYSDISRTSRDSAVSAYVGNSNNNGYDLPNYTNTQTPVRPSGITNGLFSPSSLTTGRYGNGGGGGLGDLFGASSVATSSTASSLYSSSTPLNTGAPVASHNSLSYQPSSAVVRNNLTSPRRYGNLNYSLSTIHTPTTSNNSSFLSPKYLRFDAYISGTVSLSNANRSIRFNDVSEVVSNHRSFNGQSKHQQLTEDILAAEGSRGGIVASVLPGITVSKTPGEISSTNSSLLSSGLYSFDVVIEDSDSLLCTDPEQYATPLNSSSSSAPSINTNNLFSNGGIIPLTNTATVTAPISKVSNDKDGSTVRPFEIALCLLPVGSATTAMMNGVQSSDPLAYGAVWFATNRGDVYGLAVPSNESTVPTVPAVVETTDPNAVPIVLPTAPVPSSLAVATSPKLERIASGLPYGVSSYVTISVDGTSGDIGMSIATSRCGFDKDDDDQDDEALDYSNDNDNHWEEKETKFASSTANTTSSAAYVTGESSGAPRPPPSPFVLLPRTSSGSSTSVSNESSSSASIPTNTLHCPDPSGGVQARIHAITSKLNLHNLATVANQGLQLAILARVSKGLKITLVPALKI